jgi:hypothetical protein
MEKIQGVMLLRLSSHQSLPTLLIKEGEEEGTWKGDNGVASGR